MPPLTGPVWLFALILAPVIGSFLGVIVRRLGTEKSVIRGRSACENCGSVIAPYDLVPLLSFLALKGVCRRCRARISLFHPVIEMAALLLTLWAMTVNSGAWLMASCILGWTLLGLGLCDARHYRLPDGLTLPLLLAGLGTTLILMPGAATDHALASALAYGVFRLIALVFQQLRGVAGLGHGDAKLLAASGAWLGLAALPYLVLIAAVSALMFALALRLSGRAIGRQTRLPFGPFIGLATWLLWLYWPADVFKLSLTYWLF